MSTEKSQVKIFLVQCSKRITFMLFPQEQEKKENYPFYLGVSKIKSAGIGVFTRIGIKKDEDLTTYMRYDCISVKNIKDKELEKKFCFKSKKVLWCPKDFGRMSIFWYTNHSDFPNVECANDEYTAIRNIKKEEELTIDYKRLDEDVSNLNFKPLHFKKKIDNKRRKRK